MADRYAVGDPDDVSPRDRADRGRLGLGHDTAVTAQEMGVDPAREDDTLPPRTQPGEWLEHAPLLMVSACWRSAGRCRGLRAIHGGSRSPTLTAIIPCSSWLGLVRWRPKLFLNARLFTLPVVRPVMPSADDRAKWTGPA
jgi:short-chain fatty acids transporter